MFGEDCPYVIMKGSHTVLYGSLWYNHHIPCFYGPHTRYLGLALNSFTLVTCNVNSLLFIDYYSFSFLIIHVILGARH